MSYKSDKKTVYYIPQAQRELLQLPLNVRIEFEKLFLSLEKYGKLNLPFGKKLHGFSNLYEARVRGKNHYRALYSYAQTNNIYILVIFKKKSQKTPNKFINLAIKRFKSNN